MWLTLTVAEILQLQYELLAEKGLMNNELPILVKYNLRKLLQEIEKEVELFNSMRDDLIKKHSPEGKIEQLNPDGSVNTKFLQCTEEINKILSQEIKVNHAEFKIEDFDFKTEMDFQILFKIIDNCLVSQNGSLKKRKEVEKHE